MSKVVVSGCFDLVHSGHVAFLSNAASYGDLYVCVGSCENIKDLKGTDPLFSEEERVYLLNSLSCVTLAKVAKGRGVLDFSPDLDEIKPDVFIVNEDGHTCEKQKICEEKGIQYIVLSRTPESGFPCRSSSQSKSFLNFPYRVCIAGGWLDQPWMNSICQGSVITAQLSPSQTYMERSGLATSTRSTAKKIWKGIVPSGNSIENAKILFACENPPDSAYISGSQDAIGLLNPGINRLDYGEKTYWPEKIEAINDRKIIDWLERVLHFVEIGPRGDSYDPLVTKNLTEEGVKRLARSSNMAWQAIKNCDVKMLGQALNETADSWEMLLPNTVPQHCREMRNRYGNSAGTSLTGCGGGYLMLVDEKAPKESMPISITSRF